MRKGVTAKLLSRAKEVAEWYSKPDRDHNYGSELFSVGEVRILSEHRALVIYEKSSGLRVMADFIYIPAKDRWMYYIPTDSHLLNLERLVEAKYAVEQHNLSVRDLQVAIEAEEETW